MKRPENRADAYAVTDKPVAPPRDFDCLVDLRSTGFEHWTYNYGLVREVLEIRASRPTRIRATRAFADLLQRLGISAAGRLEWPKNIGGHFTKLLMRELLSAVEVVLAAISSRRILVPHAHPLGLFLAWPVLSILGGRFTVCLHNDFLITLRERGREQTLERVLWWCVAQSNRRLTFVAQNKYYARYVRKFFPRATVVVVWPHPITPRAIYEEVASSVEDIMPIRVNAGFFGRVQPDRGISAFERHVSRHPNQSFAVAGTGASSFPDYENTHRYERPSTDVYCALMTRSDSLFIDLRNDVYRIGESGVYWDAVGLGISVIHGNLPLMYRIRLRRHFCDGAVPTIPREFNLSDCEVGGDIDTGSVRAMD